MLSARRRERNADSVGDYLRAARERAGFTQKALADTVGLEYYTMVSQMELGYVAIPPTLWVPLANALRLDRHDFALRCLDAYQPEVYKALYDHRGRREIATALALIQRGALDHLIGKNLPDDEPPPKLTGAA